MQSSRKFILIEEYMMVNKRKRVLYIAHGHPDFSPGGGEVAAFFNYKGMQEHEGYEAYFLFRQEDPGVVGPGLTISQYERDPNAFIYSTCNIEYDHFYQTRLSVGTNFDVIGDYPRFLRELAPDIVHFHHYLHLGIELISITKEVLPKAKIFLSLHEFAAICANHGAMIKVGDGRLCYSASRYDCKSCYPERQIWEFDLRKRKLLCNFELVDKFIAPGNFLRQRYIDWGLPAEKVILMEYGRPKKQVQEIKKNKTGTSFRVGFFAQVVFHKGADIFLKAAAEYLRRKKSDTAAKIIPELTFKVHGIEYNLPEPLHSEIQRLKSLTTEIVQFYGQYSQNEIQKLMSAMDCIVVPSKWWENTPFVILEAFEAGVPVICSNIGGMAEMVTDRVNGLHFMFNDHFDLLDKIVELASSKQLQNKLVKNIPPKFTDTEMCIRLDRLYQEPVF